LVAAPVALADFRPLAETFAALVDFRLSAAAPLPTALASGTSIRRPLFTS
jgi:hypothetical protein